MWGEEEEDGEIVMVLGVVRPRLALGALARRDIRVMGCDRGMFSLTSADHKYM